MKINDSTDRPRIFFQLLCFALLPFCSFLGLLGQDYGALFPIRHQGLVGFINSAGTVVIPPIYVGAREFSEGLVCVRIGNSVHNKEGYIDPKGVLAIPAKFDACGDFSEGLAAVFINGKYGFIDRKGDFAITPRFDAVGSFSNGRAWVKMSEKYGYIDRLGIVKIPPTLFDADDFSAGLAYAMTFIDGIARFGYIDRDGNWKISPKYIFARPFSEGVAVVGINGKTAVLDGKSVTVIGKARYAVIDTKDKRIFSSSFEDVGSHFSDGLLAVKLDGKWGYLNRKGSFAIMPQFDAAANFSEGFAAVEVDGKKFYVNEKGERVFDADFWHIGPFKNGLASVEIRFSSGDYRFGYINSRGKIVWAPTR
ncbi:MAG: WG repeat-containing protein [Firmicutes bacterium]|nr:WG repeat-containing protein [Bacillota bacterium]